MSLFGKMNQTEKAKTTAGSSGKQPWRSRWQKGSKALYHIGRLPVTTYLHIARYRKWSTPLLQAGCRGFF